MSLPIYFAPLQGFTSAAYRLFHSQIFGNVATYCVSFARIEHGVVRARDLRDMCPNPNLNQLPQIIVADVVETKQLVEAVSQLGYQQIDINLGCPYPMQTGKGRGAALLANADNLRHVLDAACVANGVQMSVKMRLGFASADECLQIAPLLNQYPLHHVTVHARIASQQYDGDCNMTAFGEFYKTCKHQLIYNGNLTTIEQIQQIENQFPNLAGVMIGRGLLANPALASEYVKGAMLSKTELYKKVGQLHAELFAHNKQVLEGPMQVLLHMQNFWQYLLPDADAKLKKKIGKTRSLSSYESYVSQLLNA